MWNLLCEISTVAPTRGLLHAQASRGCGSPPAQRPQTAPPIRALILSLSNAQVPTSRAPPAVTVTTPSNARLVGLHARVIGTTGVRPVQATSQGAMTGGATPDPDQAEAVLARVPYF